jgi:hypothetical protein
LCKAPRSKLQKGRQREGFARLPHATHSVRIAAPLRVEARRTSQLLHEGDCKLGRGTTFHFNRPAALACDPQLKLVRNAEHARNFQERTGLDRFTIKHFCGGALPYSIVALIWTRSRGARRLSGVRWPNDTSCCIGNLTHQLGWPRRVPDSAKEQDSCAASPRNTWHRL